MLKLLRNGRHADGQAEAQDVGYVEGRHAVNGHQKLTHFGHQKVTHPPGAAAEIFHGESVAGSSSGSLRLRA